MVFLDKLFRWKKKPFKPAQVSASQKLQSGKEKMDKVEARGTGQYAHMLRRPHISEKVSGLGELNQYAFEVEPSSSKPEIARAIRDLYGLAPEQVNIVNMGGRQVRFGRTRGATKGWKKAIVTLPAGKSIDVYKK